MSPNTTPTLPNRPGEADTALVVFAAPDLWSSLQSLAWCLAAGGIDTNFFGSTGDITDSNFVDGSRKHSTTASSG